MMDQFVSDLQNTLTSFAVDLLDQYFSGIIIFLSIIGTLELMKAISKDSLWLTVITRFVELFFLLYLINIAVNKLEQFKIIF